MPLKLSFPTLIQKIKFFLIFFIPFCLTFIALLIIKSYFSITEIEIIGIKKINGLNYLSKKIIFLLDSEKVKEKILLINSNLKEIDLVKIYPNKIRIKAIEYQPLSLLKTEGGFLILASDGKILERQRDTDYFLPLINYYQKLYFQNFSVNKKIDLKEILFALYFNDKMNYIGLKIETIDIKGPDMIILNSEGKSFIFTLNRKKEIQFEELKMILSKLKLEKINFEGIDLRFEKPVIKLLQ